MRESMRRTVRRSGPSRLGLAFLIAVSGAVVAGTPAVAAGAAPAAHAVPGPGRGAATSPIAGHWEADMQGDGRMFSFLFDLTVKGDSLGGSLAISNREGEIRIAGRVKGRTLHFEQFGLWDGTLEGSSLKLTRGLDGGKVQHMTAHRVPAN